VIHPDGSVSRQTSIDGRGANLFRPPSGPGWQAKSWETKGGQTVLPDTYYHIFAQGEFAPHQVIPSDYEFDVERQIKAWGRDERDTLDRLGIKPPYKEKLFSKNRIQVNRVKGLLTQTYIYEETFQTAGEIQLLMLDLKDEVKKQYESRGESIGDAELESLAKIRLEDEFLSQFHFQSEVVMPGRIISSNAASESKGKVFWKFTAKDFQGQYSIYTLRAVSRSLSMTGIIFFIAVGFFAVIVIFLTLFGMQRYKKQGPSKGKKSRE
jgi:hypothetical protein